MLTLFFIIILLTVVVLGDVLYLEITEAAWNLRQRFPRWRLNFDKRRRPQRTRREYR